ncbi:MAG: multidrug effflux MFS transporter [Rhodospirillales bacterium]|nr:multidrug effflux MFS transporter [Rhodospirillales bacterium]
MTRLIMVTRQGGPTPVLVMLMTALAGLGQFASNIYIPSMPAVAAALGATMSAVQTTLAVFLATFAIFQLICGPLSDRLGRRRVLFAGMATFIAGTVVCVLSADLACLIGGRVLQGAGASAAFVVSRAITRDLFTGPALARLTASILMAFSLVPGLTPLIGGLLQEWGGWRWTFGATVVFGVVLFALVLRIGETNLQPIARLDAGAIRGAYRDVLRSRAFLQCAISSALAFACLSAFFAGSPDMYIGRLGVRPIEYGLYPPLTLTGYVLGGLLTRRLVGKLSTTAISGLGLSLIAVATVAIAAFPAAGILHKHIFTGCMIVFVTGLGVFMPTAVAAALTPFANTAGSASAMLGFLQTGGCALGAFAVSALLGRLPVLAFPSVMAVGGIAAALSFVCLQPRQTKRERANAADDPDLDMDVLRPAEGTPSPSLPGGR